MKIKTLLITSLMASTLFFSLQASAAGSGPRCHAAEHELIDAERALRELEGTFHSFRDLMAAEYRVLVAESAVALACEASTIGGE